MDIESYEPSNIFQEPSLIYFLGCFMHLYGDNKLIGIIKLKKDSNDISMETELMALYCEILRVILVFLHHHFFQQSFLVPASMISVIFMRIYKLIILKKYQVKQSKQNKSKNDYSRPFSVPILFGFCFVISALWNRQIGIFSFENLVFFTLLFETSSVLPQIYQTKYIKNQMEKQIVVCFMIITLSKVSRFIFWFLMFMDDQSLICLYYLLADSMVIYMFKIFTWNYFFHKQKDIVIFHKPIPKQDDKKKI